MMHWYRFGPHNHHSLVQNNDRYAASDLLQGRVGDCWFLSALAVIAERTDLIRRLFPSEHALRYAQYGIVRVKLFMDGYWKTVTMDTFLPCLMEFHASAAGNAQRRSGGPDDGLAGGRTLSSDYDPGLLSDASRSIIRETKEYLQQDREKKTPFSGGSGSLRSHTGNVVDVHPIDPGRSLSSTDLAYSKAKGNQLWVPYLEKAYAKIHGSYHAISGGHIAEAFLDLTGAPTLVYNFDHPSFSPKPFWSKLLSYRHQHLPMGCGTSTSQVGIMGGHAYSLLDVKEITGVAPGYFREDMATGTLGGVSGFTEYDGTVRLLRIRNPHGQGEWKGQFSDGSSAWEDLMEHHRGTSTAKDGTSDAGAAFERTMENDGTFWIDYDSFLMGFSNVDVVLAFQGNHAKSFSSNFPMKKSGHRCTRAFEISMLEDQPGMRSMESVEVYAMLIQKTRRGASHGRVDRKKSYKICDMGLLVANSLADHTDCIDYTQPIDAKMLGLTRVGHHRIVLNRRTRQSTVIMPVSFGHPAATDKLMSFTVRFVSNAPIMIHELPEVPRMDRVLHKLCIESAISPPPYCVGNWQRQGRKRILLDGAPEYRVFLIDCTGSGIVFFYLFINNELRNRPSSVEREGWSFSIQLKCRGMMCRTEHGLLEHEKVKDAAPRKKFEAAWRQYRCDFAGETMSRLLMVLVRSGQDCEFKVNDASCSLKRGHVLGSAQKKKDGDLKEYFHRPQPSPAHPLVCSNDDYDKRGIFNQVINEIKDTNQYLYPNRNESIDMYDSELKEALSISKSETELQQVLEMSKQHNVHSRAAEVGHTDSIDLDLQRAIEMSKRGSTINRNRYGSNEDDSDLAKAIQLSVVSHQDKRSDTVIGKEHLVDVDLSPIPMHKSPNDPAEVIEILDDDESNIPFIRQQENFQKPSIDCKKEVDPRSVDEKRKHAYEAAMKRFSTK